MLVDGLYITNVWVAKVDYALTIQGNDISQPDTRKASYSNSFVIPDTLAMRELLQGAEQVDAFGPNPYYKLPAYLLENGEVLFYGFAEFSEFSAGWSVNLLDAIVGFFDYIKDKKINVDLDMSQYDHKWSIKTINQLAGASEGICYPLIDAGSIEGGSIPYDTMTPATYYKTVVNEIIGQAGYRPVGKWLSDPLYVRMALPFTQEEPKSQGEDWITDRSARVTVGARTEYGKRVDHIVPYSVDNDFQAGWTDGKRDNFKPDRHVYVCDVDMRLKVQAFQSFDVTVITGFVETRLAIHKNGKEVAHTYRKIEGLYNSLGSIRDTIEIDEEIVCRAGDEISIRFMFDKLTVLGKYKVNIVESDLNTWASFIPSPVVGFGDVWPVGRNLPDLTYTELLLTLAKIMSATYDVKDSRKTVELVPLDRVTENIPAARDWSDRIDEKVEPRNTVKMDGYGQRNWLRWKDQEKEDNRGFGDGYIDCRVGNLPNEEELFKLPFSAVLNSETSIAGYGRPLFIETRTVTKSGETVTVTKKAAPACIILIEPACIVEVETKTLNDAGTGLRTEKVKLMGNWFSIRPIPVRRNENDFSLCFLPIRTQTEQGLIDRYYTTLKRVLRRPRVITLNLKLTPTDIAICDLAYPILLQKVRVGALDFNFGYYYPNKISSYRSNVSCPVTLIAL